MSPHVPGDLTSPAAQAAPAWAAELHAGQFRRGGRVPYIGHLLSVSALVLEDGGDETDVVVALLHDSMEDHGGAPLLSEIADRFGEDVAAAVADCTDSVADPMPSWAERKRTHLEHMAHGYVSRPALLVSAADKLDNVRHLVAQLERDRTEALSHPPAEPDEVLHYDRSMTELLTERLPGSHNVAELQRAVDELVALLDDVTPLGHAGHAAAGDTARTAVPAHR